MDTLYGGFLSTFTYDFKPAGDQDKFIVTQARHTWSTSKAAMRYPGVAYYKTCAANGYKFLHDVMWDKTYGGFYTMVDRKGNVIDSTKNAYGNAFGIYALAAYCKLTNDPVQSILHRRLLCGWRNTVMILCTKVIICTCNAMAHLYKELLQPPILAQASACATIM